MKGEINMLNIEPPTRIYIPKETDREKIIMLSQSNAPVRIYTPQSSQ